MRFIALVFILTTLTVSCGKEQGDIITLSSGSNSESEAQQYIMTVSQDTNHQGYAFYTVDGEIVLSGHFRDENATPRGLSTFDATSVLVSLDTSDSLYLVHIDGTKELFHGSGQFGGNIYDNVVSTSGRVYAIESNRIEVFDSTGIRLGSSMINTTTGGCTLSTPTGMTLNADGNLVVVNQGGGDRVLTYDISTPTATCLSSVAFGNNPEKVILGSDGYLYITTSGDDRVYRADPDGSNPTVIWDTNTSIINNPEGLIELPNGNLLVSSTATDTIEQITLAGERVGAQPFIRDTNSLNVSDIILIGTSSAAQ